MSQPGPAQLAFGDFEHELANTRKILERVPHDKLDWRPHAKSWTLGGLALHIATLPWWFDMTAQGDEYDLGTFERQSDPKSTQEILARFEENTKGALASLHKLTPEDLGKPWTLRMGDQVYFTMPKGAVLRTFAVSHIIHHRAQLTVYLRLLDVPVPGFYGPSADEAQG